MRRGFVLLLCASLPLLTASANSCGGERKPDHAPVVPPDTENPDPEQPAATFRRYYVATTGSDLAPGTLEQPFRTIGKALATLAAGDTALVRGGDYREFVNVTVSGEAGRVTTLMSYPGERARIDGTGLTITGWGQALLRMNSVKYFTVDGMDICNAANTSAPNADPEGVYINGASSNITIRDCRVYNIKSLTPGFESGGWRTAHGILAVGDAVQPIRELTIEGCEIYECHTGTSETLTIAGNIDRFTVRGCRLHDVENIGIIVAGGEGLNPSGNPMTNFARNGLIAGNEVCRCTQTKSPTVPYASDYGAIGIYICGGANTVVERNTVYGCDRGIGLVSESNIHATKDCIVRNNFVFNNFRTGIYMGDYLNYTTGGTSGCYVLNNTLFNNNSVGGWFDGTDGRQEIDGADGEGEIRLTENCTGNTVMNNIIYANLSRNDVFIRKYTASGGNNILSHNLYFTLGTPKWIWNGMHYTDFDAWRAASGDSGSTFGLDPQFLNASSSSPDLHIASGSPARNSGTALSAYFNGQTDIDGRQRIVDGQIGRGAQQ